MIVNHHREDLLFRGNAAIPMTPSSLNWIFQPRFRHVDIAELIPLLWSRFGSGSYSKVVSTLINICSPFSGFSTGYNEAPPERARPLGSHLLFTFAIKSSTEFDIESLQVNTTSIRSTVWGSGKDDRLFITIGISSVEAANLGLLHVQSNEINYLYRLIGIIFRSIFMHYTAGEVDQLKRKQDVVLDTDKSIYYYRDKYLNMPLTGIVRYPYWTWRYNLAVWEDAPNLIPYIKVDPQLALYYFMFISQNVNPICRAEDGLSRILGTVSGETTGIAKVLTQSLMMFTQYLNNPADYQFELIDLIAPNVLASLLYSGKSKVVLNKQSYREDLRANTVALAEQLTMNLTHEALAQVLAPYIETTRSMIYEDQTLSTKLLLGITT
jgi:hypothetical protein